MEAPALKSENTTSKSAGVNLGMYHADANTTIVCFGDPEGNSLKKFLRPDGANQVSDTNVLKQTVSNLTELDAYLTVEDGNLVLRPNVILVCLGDVFGDGPDNIKLARTLLELKKKDPTRVILITGNRDINKLRLGHELKPTDVCMAELTKKIAEFVRDTDAFAGFAFAFQYNQESDFDYMWGSSPKNISNKQTCLERVLYITEETLNEYYGWVFLVDEYLTTIGFTQEQIKLITLEYKSYIYVYLVQAMSGNIKCNGAPEFDGIFEEILMAGHLMACIDAGDAFKCGLMHSLPPRGKIPTIPGFIYIEQYDKGFKEINMSEDEQKNNGTVGKVKDSEINEAKKVNINEGLREFNQSLRTLIKQSRSDRTIWRELLEWVSGMTSGSYWLYNNNTISGANMPVSTVSFGTGFGQFEAASGITVQGGGGITNLEKSIAERYIDVNDFTHVVCSHSPKGYVGVKVKTMNDKFYYCVDVSKIDDQEYDVKERFGCCFLVFDLSKINEGVVDDKFIGRIMLKQSQFPNNYDIFIGHKVDKTKGIEPMYANYVISSIPPSTKNNLEQRLRLKIRNINYDFEYKTGGKEKRNINRMSGTKLLDYFTKMPTLGSSQHFMSGYGGGSRTRKRASKYLKKSARTTHKRRHISKKRKNNNNKRKDKKSKRSSTAR
jgi:Calcineurin-like phosphoesterase